LSCAQPIAVRALLDYWLDDDAPDDAVEEHLLGCDSCGERLRALVALGEGVRRLAGEGAVDMILAPSFLEQARRDGLRVREYRVSPGGRVDCTVTRADDLLVGRLTADFGDVSRVDLVALEEGQPEHRIQDVPFGRDAAEVIVAPAMPMARALGSRRIRFRLLSQEAEGERLLGEYTFDHSPSEG
jgi:hypothetical protein